MQQMCESARPGPNQSVTVPELRGEGKWLIQSQPCPLSKFVLVYREKGEKKFFHQSADVCTVLRCVRLCVCHQGYLLNVNVSARSVGRSVFADCYEHTRGRQARACVGLCRCSTCCPEKGEIICTFRIPLSRVKWILMVHLLFLLLRDQHSPAGHFQWDGKHRNHYCCFLSGPKRCWGYKSLKE